MPIESSIESPTEGVASPAGPSGAPAAGPEPAASGASRETPAALVALAEALEQEGISYCRCHGLEDHPAGDGGILLLASRAHMARMAELLARLGFKPVQPPPDEAVGGLDSYAFDPDSDSLIRVRARHQLFLGHPLTLNYRLPLEAQFLGSGSKAGAFRAPGPELELITFVLRALLGPSALDILLERRNSAPALDPLARLQAGADPERLREVLDQSLPDLDAHLLDECAKALRPGASRRRRLVARFRLMRRLRSRARRPLSLELALRFWRRLALAGSRLLLRRPSQCRLGHGAGAIIAIVGGDGSGKSTVVDGLCAWLSRDFATTSVHLGKPAWSWATAAVRGLLKLGQLGGLYPPEATFRQTLGKRSLVSIGYPWLLREVCRARDRYSLYVKARRFAAAGGLVVTDRFPLPEIRVMDGPQGRRFLSQPFDGPGRALLSPQPDDWLARTLLRLEEGYYERIASPEVLIVLRVDPEIAVQRRTGEDSIPVRERSSEIWGIDWRQTNAHIIDAAKSKAEVLDEVKGIVWAEL